ncbi:hypothetical protein F4680DRAFT_116442 [Xylaria scruposa]|nr:hypothetical protein F4680DRAFT_116442 [Xylaria scruposa]
MAASLDSGSKDPSSPISPSDADTPRPRTQPYPPPPPPQPPSQPQPQTKPQPQPRSQPQSPPRSESQKSQKQRVDGKSYYGYLFNKDKSPNDTLDALLRALGQHIIDHIGDTNDKQLSPKKLAAFYRAVGGDYDKLFGSPDRTLSYIWQALGVQHTLQPTPDNDFAQPSIPALTLRGFVRWESLQILLGPEEHVPYLQYAVANWNLKHPYTGEPFPVDLPAEAFPPVCDAAVDDWHRACGERLREAATPNEEDERPARRQDSDSRIPTTPNSKPNSASAGTVPRSRPESEYFRRRRPMSYVHVPEPRYPQPTSHPSHPTAPEANSRLSSSSGSSLEGFTRGRRHSDLKPPPVIVREETRASSHLDPHRPPHVRRHSHSYQSPYVASVHDSESDSDTLRASSRHNGSVPQPPPGVRRMPAAPASAMPASTSRRLRHSDIRPDDPRRISFPAEIKQKFTSFLMSSSNRQRSTSREPGPDLHSSVRYRKETPRTRLSRSLSGESITSDGSLPEIIPKYSRDSRERNRARDRTIERDRERDRERERARDKAREWEEEMERKSRTEKAYLRPVVNRRTSSHADVDRRRDDILWDARDRRRESRDLEREVRRNLTSDELDRRERRRYQDRGPSPTMTGVSGRRYPR